MILSLPKDELYSYVTKQADKFFPDNCTSGGTKELLIWHFGDWCTLGVGAVLRNRSLPSGHLACRDEDGSLQIKEYDNKKIIASYFYL